MKMIEINGTNRPTENSIGQPIHHTEEGIRNFYGWFGDSKTVDRKGRPVVFYHGTHSDVKQFEPNHALGGLIFASPSASYAGNFATANGANIIPVYVKTGKIHPKTSHASMEPTIGKDIRYDTFKVKDSNLPDEPVNLAVRYPSQLKSVIGNSGTYSGDVIHEERTNHYSLTSFKKHAKSLGLTVIKQSPYAGMLTGDETVQYTADHPSKDGVGGSLTVSKYKSHLKHIYGPKTEHGFIDDGVNDGKVSHYYESTQSRKTYEEFLIEAFLAESPILNDETDRGVTDMMMHKVLKMYANGATHVSSDMYKRDMPNSKILMFHTNNGKHSNASIFDVSGDTARHQVTTKLNSSAPTGIYQNIQHMIDSGHTVSSDMKHSSGGRNLWNNIHKHVNYSSAEIRNIRTGISTPVENFHGLMDSNEDTIYAIRK